MIFNMSFNVINVANKLQISISKDSTAGQRVKREARTEHTKDAAGNYLLTPHPEHDFLLASNTNYFLLSGRLKIRYEWIDGDKFQNEHKETFKSLLKEQHKNYLQGMEDNYKHGDGYMENTLNQAYRCPTWTKSHLAYEPDCAIADVVIMEDDTTLLCPMQHVTGWTFETIDIKPFEKIISTKVGTEMYIVFGRECFTWSNDGQWIRHVFEKHSVKKQTSEEIEINNGTGDVCSLVRIYK